MTTTMLTLTATNDVESGISVASASAMSPCVRRPLGIDAWFAPAIVPMAQADHDKSTCVSVPGCRGVT